ncbi:MAG: hypothetical protein ABSE18_03565 [Minisyncoccia bacterium]|jgi:hypothetical protein
MERAFAVFTIVILVAISVLPFWSAADTVSSTHFMIEDSYLGSFGGYSSSTDFQMVQGGSAITNGDAAGTGFMSNTGPANDTEFSPMSQAWEWYGDVNDETPTSSLAAQSTAPTNIANGEPLKLRLTIKETSSLAGSDNVKFRLQYSLASDFSSGVGYVTEIGSCVATSSWCYASGAGADNTLISTNILTDSDSCSGGVGNGCGTHNTSGTSTSTATQAAGAATEYEFTMQNSGAVVGTTYFFRAVNAADGMPVLLNGTSSYPSLVTQGAALTFTVSGLPQGTSTNGIVTNVSATPTGIPFGTLPVGSSLTGAQRLSVTTNAAFGYELYAFQDAPLTDAQGDKVPALNATNASPQAWGTACTSTSTACYGYHAGSAVLSSGSTRFAADDTYAGFTTTTAEIGYSGAPTTGSTMDMVYRVQTNPMQLTGSYSDNTAYVVAPTF